MKAAAELRRQVSAANRKAWETKSSSTWRAGRGQARARLRCAAAVDLGTTGGRSQGPARHGRHVTPSRRVTPSHVAAPIFLSTSTPSSRRGMIRVWSRQELCRRAPAGGLILEMDVCQRGSVAVADDGSGFGLRGGPGRREAALGQAQGLASAVRSAFRSDRSASPGHSVWYPQGS